MVAKDSYEERIHNLETDSVSRTAILSMLRPFGQIQKREELLQEEDPYATVMNAFNDMGGQIQSAFTGQKKDLAKTIGDRMKRIYGNLNVKLPQDPEKQNGNIVNEAGNQEAVQVLT